MIVSLPLDLGNRRGRRVERHVCDLAALETDQAVSHGGKRGVMGDDDDRDAVVAAGVLQQLQDLLARLVVEGAGGLVAEQQLGVFSHGASDGDALLLSARKLGGEVCHAVLEADLGERLGGIERVRAHLRRKLDVFKGGEVGHQVVELEDEADVGAAVFNKVRLACMGNVASVHHQLAGGRGIHASQDVEGSGLAGAGSAQDDRKLAALYLKRGPIECMDEGLARTVCLYDVAEFYIGHRRSDHSTASCLFEV